MTPGTRMDPARVAAVAAVFRLPGEIVGARPQGGGLINDTFVIHTQGHGVSHRSVLQRINTAVFRDVAGVMDNIERVTGHLSGRGGRTLRLIGTRAGGTWHRDPEGGCWRAYGYIDGAHTREAAQGAPGAFQVARGFGLFQRALLDLPGPRLKETIAGFHDTRRRFEALRASIAADRAGRARDCGQEIDFALKREAVSDVLLRLFAEGSLPERIVHNDAKPNNAMLDDVSGECIGVVDLDTVMPGLALYDFGDLVRSASNATVEDDPDTGRVAMRTEIFEGLARGYASAAAAFLTEAERAHLAFAGKLITYENGMRFLADHLDGDVYYKTTRPSHNLDRARNQFALVRSIEAQEADMQKLAAEAVADSLRNPS